MNPTAYIAIGVTLFIAGMNCAFWAVTKFNDMKHMSIDIDTIKKDVKSLLEYQHSVDKRVVRLETRIKSLRKRD